MNQGVEEIHPPARSWSISIVPTCSKLVYGLGSMGKMGNMGICLGICLEICLKICLGNTLW